MGRKQQLEALPVVGTAMAVQKRYKHDGADPYGAAIGFFAFLSLFPLMLLAVSLAGFVLDDPDDQIAVAEAITAAIPGFEATLQDGDADTQVATLVEGVVEQRGSIGSVGMILLLLSGLRVINAAMIALRVIFRGEIQSGVMAKVRQVAALAGLGGLALLGVAGSSVAVVDLGLPSFMTVVISVAVTFAFDLLLFIGAYRLLSPTTRFTVRELLPGALLAAFGWTALKVAGASYVSNQVDSANALYGALGGVIALMLLFYLAGRLYLYGAELIAVRLEHVHGPLPRTSDRVSADQVARVPRARATSDPDDDGPPPPPRAARVPRPRDPGPAGRSSTVGLATRERLDAEEVRRQAARDRDGPGAPVREGVAFGLGLAAVVAVAKWVGRGEQ